MKAIVLDDIDERIIDMKYAVFQGFKMHILTFLKSAWPLFLVAREKMASLKISVILNLMKCTV